MNLTLKQLKTNSNLKQNKTNFPKRYIKIIELFYQHFSKKEKKTRFKFKANMKNIQNPWKSTITVKSTSSNILKNFWPNDTTIANQVHISNTFNNYFSSTDQKTKVNTNQSHKYFSDLLKDGSKSSFFLFPTNKTQIQNISSFISNKSVGLNKCKNI